MWSTSQPVDTEVSHAGRQRYAHKCDETHGNRSVILITQRFVGLTRPILLPIGDQRGNRRSRSTSTQ